MCSPLTLRLMANGAVCKNDCDIFTLEVVSSEIWTALRRKIFGFGIGFATVHAWYNSVKFGQLGRYWPLSRYRIQSYSNDVGSKEHQS